MSNKTKNNNRSGVASIINRVIENSDDTTKKPKWDNVIVPSLPNIDGDISDTESFASTDTTIDMKEHDVQEVEVPLDDFLSNMNYAVKKNKNNKDSRINQPSIIYEVSDVTHEHKIIINNKEATHCFISMPAMGQFFCTHCLGTIQISAKESHINNCFYKNKAALTKFNCGVCNAKPTADNARVHYNSLVHSNRTAYIESLIKNDKCYYITASSASIIKPQSLSDQDICYTIALNHYNKRLEKARHNELDFAMTPAEKLSTLITQIVSMKRDQNTSVQIDLASRNKLMALFTNLLSEINSGYKMCHIPGEKNDFIQPANLIDAIKIVLQHSAQKMEDPKARHTKNEQIETLFSLQDGKETSCLICQTKHSQKIYKARTSLYAVIRNLMESIQN